MIYASTEVQRLLHAFFNRMEMAGVPPSALQRSALTICIRDIDANIGLSKFEAIYPMLGGTAATHALDLKSVHDITWGGTVTHNDAGALSNGSTGYGDTGWQGGSSTDFHLAFYGNNEPTPANSIAIGATAGDNRQYLFYETGPAGVQSYLAVTAAGASSEKCPTDDAAGTFNGFIVSTIGAAKEHKCYKAGTLLETTTSAGGFPAVDLHVLALYDGVSRSNFCRWRGAFASFGLLLTPTEVTAFDAAVETYQATLNRDNSRVGTYLSKVIGTGATLTQTQKDAIVALDTALEGIGIGKFTAIYPFVGGSAAAHAIDLLGNYPITWNGGITHDASGILGNGTSGYGATGIIPSSDAIVLQDSAHIACYHNQDPAVGSGVSFGCNDGTYYFTQQATRAVDSIDYYYVNSGTFSNPGAGTPPDGFFVTQRELSTHQDQYQNGTRTNNHAVTSTGLSTVELYLLAQNNNGTDNAWAADQISFASVGAGLTSGENTTFNTAVQAYATALSRAA